MSVVVGEVQHLCRERRFEDALERISATLDEQRRESALSETVKVQLLYLKGTALGGLGQHEAVLRHAACVMKDHPEAPAGFYLYGFALNALRRVNEAAQYFREAQRLDRQLRGDAAAAASQRVEGMLRASRAQQYRDAMHAHAKLYSTFTPARCPKCDAAFNHPTPEWYCARCFPGSLVLVWEPDEQQAKCRVCGKRCTRGSRHHCRCCGRLCCSSCSTRERPLPLLNYKKAVRVCDTCTDIYERHCHRVDSGQQQQQQQQQESQLALSTSAARPSHPTVDSAASAASEEKEKEEVEEEDASGNAAMVAGNDAGEGRLEHYPHVVGTYVGDAGP